MRLDQPVVYESEPPMYELEEVTDGSETAGAAIDRKPFVHTDDNGQVYVVSNTDDMPESQYEVEYLQDTPNIPNKPDLHQMSPLAKRKRYSAKPSGLIENINHRLNRIERKVDILLNYLVGDNYDLGEIDEDIRPVIKNKRFSEGSVKKESQDLGNSSE